MKRKIKPKHKIINSFLVILIFVIIIFAMIVEYKEKEISSKQNKYMSPKVSYNNINFIYNQEENNHNEVNSNQQEKDIPKNKIEEKYKGYDVAAKLIIPKIELETYVLKNFSIETLNISVTKFWGPKPNELR